MSETKDLIDEYAARERQLVAALAELETALVLVLARYGSTTKSGVIVLAAPAASRRKASQFQTVDVKWSTGNATKGSLRITAKLSPKKTKGKP